MPKPFPRPKWPATWLQIERCYRLSPGESQDPQDIVERIVAMFQTTTK